MQIRQHLAIIILAGFLGGLFALEFAALPRLPSSVAPLDGGKNVTMARNLAERGVLSDDIAPPFRPSARRMPLYPMFVAGWFRLGASHAAILAIQYLLAVLIPALTYFLAREFLRPGAAFAVGLIMAIHPTELAMPSTFDDAWFFQIFWLAGFLFYVRGLKRDTPRSLDLLISGSLLALSGLARPLTMTLWPLLVLGLVMRFRRQALRPGAVFVVTLALLWSPWFIRNWKTFHTFFITTQDAYILTWDTYAYYLADARGITRPEAKHLIRLDIEKITDRNLPFEGGDEIDDPFLNEPELAAIAKRYVFKNMLKDPIGYGVAHLRHSLPFWTGSSLREFLASTPFYPKQLLATLPNFTREITAGNWPAVRAGFARAGPWLALYALDALVFIIALYGLAAAGLWRLGHSGDRVFETMSLVFFLLLAASALLTSGVYIGPRYRFPFEPFLLILAAIALTTTKHSSETVKCKRE